MGTKSESASRVGFRALPLITRQMASRRSAQLLLRNRIARFGAVSTIGGLVAVFASPSVHAQPMGPCAQIRMACEQAGFVQGGARGGNGLQIDCVRPIMQGVPQPPNAIRPAPPVDPQLVAACRARNPRFGQPWEAIPGPVGQPRAPVQGPAAEPPQTSSPAQPPDSEQPALPTQPQAGDPRSPCGS
jgi:hypothetical protein